MFPIDFNSIALYLCRTKTSGHDGCRDVPVDQQHLFKFLSSRIRHVPCSTSYWRYYGQCIDRTPAQQKDIHPR
jgi:hypothetical protein